MATNRDKRLEKLADIGSIIQDGKDFINTIVPGTFDKPSPAAQPKSQAPTSSAKSDGQIDIPGAVSYNTRSEETFKAHEEQIKKILGTTADWKSPEFAQAVYDWQKTHGLTGKWVDGKFGPLTMAEVAKSDPQLKENYGAESVSPWLPGGKIKLRLTGYWPFTARADEQKMEGGIFDRKMPSKYKNQPDSPEYQAHVLHTVEQHLADPAKHPFVSLSGDDAIWPYGQEIDIPWFGQTIRGRVVDTGSHFRGKGKVYRSPGYEPIDVCVNSSQTKVPTHVVAQVVGGAADKQQPPLVANINAIRRVKTAKVKARKLILDGIK